MYSLLMRANKLDIATVLGSLKLVWPHHEYKFLFQEFMREARIMVTLNHPCIVKLIGVTGGKPMMLVSCA